MTKYDLCQQHHVSVQCLETYYMKNSISHQHQGLCQKGKKVSGPQKLEF